MRISSKKKVLVLGDSHTWIFENEKFKSRYQNDFNIYVQRVGGATISGLTNPNSATNAKQLFEYAYRSVSPEVVILQLGEVDIGFVIWYRAQKHEVNIEDAFARCIENYGNFIQRCAGKEKTIVISTPLPTIKDDQDWGDIANARREVNANQRARTEMTLRFNKEIKTLAKKLGALYLDLDSQSIGPDSLVAPFLLNADKNNHHYQEDVYLNIVMEHLEPIL
jgi:lysophospholipase L1-like esterase